jgi:hypothetical protein
MRQINESISFYALIKRTTVKCEIILRTLNKQHSIDSLDNLEDVDPFFHFILEVC